MTENAFECPICKYKTEVIETRVSRRTGTIRRRRQCPVHGETFTTREITDIEYKLLLRYKRKIIELKKYFKDLSL